MLATAFCNRGRRRQMQFSVCREPPLWAVGSAQEQHHSGTEMSADYACVSDKLMGHIWDETAAFSIQNLLAKKSNTYFEPPCYGGWSSKQYLFLVFQAWRSQLSRTLPQPKTWVGKKKLFFNWSIFSLKSQWEKVFSLTDFLLFPHWFL